MINKWEFNNNIYVSSDDDFDEYFNNNIHKMENLQKQTTIINNLKNDWITKDNKIFDLTQKLNLVNDGYALKLLWKENFKSCMLEEAEKNFLEIEKYIRILEDFEKNTKEGLQNHFKCLS